MQRLVYDGLQENISLLWVLELGSYLSATSRKTTTGIVDILNILNVEQFLKYPNDTNPGGWQSTSSVRSEAR